MRNKQKSTKESNTDASFRHPKKLPVKRSFGACSQENHVDKNTENTVESHEPLPKLSYLGMFFFKYFAIKINLSMSIFI